MVTCITGATGYIGSHVVARLLESGHGKLALLVRDASPQKLWRALQLHLDPDAFEAHLAARLILVEGDLTRPRLGLDRSAWDALAERTDSILHCAASLNRKSERACLNVNLRGTLEMIRLAQRARERGGLDRFSFVSTVAVAGERRDACVKEDEAIDWNRRDYDPYARTKKFCEHMLETLLPDTSRTVFRPSIVLGDSRRPQTTQFDMVKAFAFLADRLVLPLRREDRIDIVPVDFVADAIAGIHADPSPAHGIYHLSAGEDALTYAGITSELAAVRGNGPPLFWPRLEAPYRWTARTLAALLRGSALGRAAARLQVFLPYLTFNTVFDNRRAVEALGRKPPPFSSYCNALLRWSREHHFRYPYREWPR